MLKIIKERELKEETYYTLEFDYEDGCGFAFPCNKNGEVILNEYSKKSYDFCIKNKKNFISIRIIEHHNSYWESAIGKCSCGEKVFLQDEYMGAFQCPKCGQWYNLFGQELLPPDQWEEDYDY